MPPRYRSLAIDVPPRHRDWLAARLSELGYDAFEERSVVRARRLVIYDVDEARLEHCQRELRRLARESDARLELAFEAGEPGNDWESRWLAHLGEVELTPELRLVPRAPDGTPDTRALYLSPAFAFGFGEHASTRLAARWVIEQCAARPGSSWLDVGSGTGVLALIAKKRGAGRVLGIDLAEPAVAAARENARQNALAGVSFELIELAQVSECFDYVVCNVEAPVLSSLAPELCRKMNTAGALCLSGFIEEQVPALVRRYAECGVQLELRGREGEFCLLATGAATPRDQGRLAPESGARQSTPGLPF